MYGMERRRRMTALRSNSLAVLVHFPSVGFPYDGFIPLNLELFYDRGHHHEFLSLSQELAAPGEMRQAQTFDFNFKNVEKQFESYHGINVKLRYVWDLSLSTILTSIRYFVRVSISRRMHDVVKEKDIWVHSFRMPPDSNNSIKMEVGIEDCLHIEFEYNKSKCVLYTLPTP